MHVDDVTRGKQSVGLGDAEGGVADQRPVKAKLRAYELGELCLMRGF